MMSRVKWRLGRRFRHWGEIPPPRLPEELERLDPRLRGLGENALLRFLMFQTGIRTDGEKRSGALDFLNVLMRVVPFLALAVVVFWLLSRMGGRGAGWMALLLNLGFQFIFFLVWTTVRPGGWVRFYDKLKALSGQGPAGYSMSMLDTYKPYMHDLRLAPLTPHDYALAQWGSMMLQNSLWRKHPATALYFASRLTHMRLEAETGWSFYPSMFQNKPDDGLMRRIEGAPAEGPPSGPIIAEEVMLGENEKEFSADYYDYAKRLDYLADIWRELLDVWRPDHPLEGQIRKAIRPTRFHAELDERIKAAGE